MTSRPTTADRDDGTEGPIEPKVLEAFVGRRSAYYLSRWTPNRQESAPWISLNLSGLVFGPYWALYRRMYGLGAIVLALLWIPAVLVVAGWVGGFDTVSTGLLALFRPLAWTGELPRFFRLSILDLSWIASCLFFGFFGNRLYLAHAVRRLRAVRANGNQRDPAELGGVRWRGLVVVACVGAGLMLAVTFMPMESLSGPGQ